MIYRFGDFSLDTARQQLFRSGEPVDVEPMALDLLQFLVAQNERLVTKEELFSVLWNGRAVTASALSTCLKSARRAVEDSGSSQKIIKTIHGKGFRWIAPVSILASDVRIAETEPVVAEAGEANSLISTGRPSIAILPFDVLGTDVTSSTLSEAIPHELIAAISRLRWISVIARGSSFRFRSNAGDLGAIGRRLGVRFCLTGSVEVAGKRVTVSVELADTTGAEVIWADQFQSALEDVHQVRETIIAQVVFAVEVQIPLSEATRARLRSPDNIDVWSLYHLGLQNLYRFEEDNNHRAVAMFEKAISLEPGFARAHAALSFAHFKTAFMHYSSDRDQAAMAARGTAERAIELDPMDPFANFSMGRSLWLFDDLSGALEWLNRSTALSPSFAQGLYARAWTETVSGSSSEGRRLSDDARALSPLDPMLYAMLATRAMSLSMEGRDEEAAGWAVRAANAPGAHDHIWLIAVLTSELAGKRELAQQWAQRLKQRKHNISQEQFFRSFPFGDDAVKARFSEALSRHNIR